MRLPIIAAAALIATSALGAPALPKTAQVPFSRDETVIAFIAISNAGAACDAGVKQYCQILGVRDGVLKKLVDANKSLTTTAK